MIGDYLLQSHWMATKKTTDSKVATIHAIMYTLPFISLKPSAKSLIGIGVTHFLIDRFRLARYVVWAKNRIAPRKYHHTVTSSGMPENTPDWLAYSLLFVTDNTLHVLVNAICLGRE